MIKSKIYQNSLCRLDEISNGLITVDDIIEVAENISYQYGINQSKLVQAMESYLSRQGDHFRVPCNGDRAFMNIKKIKTFNNLDDLCQYALNLAGYPIKTDKFYELIRKLAINSKSIQECLEKVQNQSDYIKVFENFVLKESKCLTLFMPKDKEKNIFIEPFNYVGLKLSDFFNFVKWPFPSSDIFLLKILDKKEYLNFRNQPSLYYNSSNYLSGLEETYRSYIIEKRPNFQNCKTIFEDAIKEIIDVSNLNKAGKSFLENYRQCLNFMEMRKITPNMQRKDVNMKRHYNSIMSLSDFYGLPLLNFVCAINLDIYWRMIKGRKLCNLKGGVVYPSLLHYSTPT